MQFGSFKFSLATLRWSPAVGFANPVEHEVRETLA